MTTTTAIATALSTIAAVTGIAGTAQASPRQEIPGRYIVQVQAGHAPRGLADTVKARPRHVYEHALRGFAAELNAGQLTALRRNPHVERIEPDAVVTAQATQTVSGGHPWGLDRIDQRARPLSGSYVFNRTASSVRAYVLDTGIATAHPEFEGRALNVKNTTSGGASDCNGHGTHVAGTIGGRTWGVAKKVMLRGVKVLGGDCGRSGSMSDVIAGVDWVKANGIKPAVVNMSLGGGYNVFVDLAVDALDDAGFLVVVAAGNDNKDACNASPAAAARAFTVAATDNLDRKAGFSNWGTCVELNAPGVSIRSTDLGGSTSTKSGTSMAAPHVAGVAALLQHFGTLSPATLRSWLITNATTGVVGGGVGGTPNRLLFKSTL